MPPPAPQSARPVARLQPRAGPEPVLKPFVSSVPSNNNHPAKPVQIATPSVKKPLNAGFIFRLLPFGLGVLTVFVIGILLGGPANQALASTIFFKAAMTQQATVQNLFSTSTAPPAAHPTQIIEGSPERPVLGQGARQTRDLDGMEMVFVPAGPFLMGTNPGSALSACKSNQLECQPNWFADEEPMHTVQVDAYWIDQTEVSNGQYARCVNAGVCSPPLTNSSVTRTDYYGNSAFTNYPVINVDWNMAGAYCSWAGARLPTEKEWEKAARGPDGRLYPWGNTFSPELANITSTDTTSVGSYQANAGPYGAFDMAGNVWEWTSDVYDVYPGGNPNASTDFGLTSRVVRGGSWSGSFNDGRSANRDRGEIFSYFSDLGFRCAHSN